MSTLTVQPTQYSLTVTEDGLGIVSVGVQGPPGPPGSGGGEGSGAPTTAQYVTLATDSGLTNERVLTAGSDITLTDGGANGALTVAVGANVPRLSAANTYLEDQNIVGSLTVGGDLNSNGVLFGVNATFSGGVTSATFSGDGSALTGITAAQVGADASGTAAAAVAAHEAAGDPHPQYLTAAEGNAAYQPLDGDLTALAALTGTGTIYYRSAADTWTAVTVGSGLSFAAGTLSATGGGGGGAPTGAQYVTLATDVDLTAERVLTAGAGITITDGGAGGAVTVACTITQYTDEQAQDATGAMAANSARVTLTYVDATPSLTADLVADAITAGYLHATATDVLFGRATAAAGAGEEIACTAFARSILDDTNAAAARTTLGLAAVASSGSASDLSAGTVPAARMPALTGDVTTTAGAVATTVANNAVSDAKLRDSAALSVIGRSANSAGDPADIAANADGQVLRRSGTALGFGTVATAGIADAAVTYAKIQSVADNRILGRSAGSAGAAQEVAVGPSLRWRSNQPNAGGTLTTATDGATVTFDLNTSNRQIVTLGGNRTLALSNDADGDSFVILLKQDATGGRTVTWWSGIKWAGGTTPTLTTTAGKIDVFSFVRLASGEYLGTSALNF